MIVGALSQMLAEAYAQTHIHVEVLSSMFAEACEHMIAEERAWTFLLIVWECMEAFARIFLLNVWACAESRPRTIQQ